MSHDDESDEGEDDWSEHDDDSDEWQVVDSDVQDRNGKIDDVQDETFDVGMNGKLRHDKSVSDDGA